MEEEVVKKKTKKETTTTATANEVDYKALFEQMQKELKSLKEQLADSNNKKSDLQNLVEALREDADSKKEKQLPKKVKLVSLIPNVYNLSTDRDGSGKVFSFKDFGDVITMKTSELEEILSIQNYREQAENGYFYILDKDIVEDQELSDAYEKIYNKDVISKVLKLEDDECVNIFCNLDKDFQDSLASKMAENINNGIKLDRNRLSDISMRTEIDIEKIAESFKKAHK